MKFSRAFRLNASQAQLDFIDVDPTEDLPLFFDPYQFSVDEDSFSIDCNNSIVSFFEAVMNCIRSKDNENGRRLLNHLGEPNEICLGWSKGAPRGRGVGALQAEQLYRQLANSRAAQTGKLSDLSECALFIEGIGPDKISDITANIIRRQLIDYTQAQCDLHGIMDLQSVPSKSLWNGQIKRWEQKYVDLPIVDHKPVVLVPKNVVRWINTLSHQAQKYYQHFVLNFLRDENLRNDTALVKILKTGERRVYKKDVAEKHPLSKDFLFQFSQDNPVVLANYKAAYSKTKSVQDTELDEDLDISDLCDGMAAKLRSIPPGRSAADDFHNFMIRALEFIFSSSLMYPRKEHPIHSGRKRIDIIFTNSAREGFFKRLHETHQITCPYIIIECKNYSADPANPEFDQLTGRFSPNRGRFGFMVARTCADEETLIARCTDALNDGRGLIIPLFDSDIIDFLNAIKSRRWSAIDALLESKLLQVIN